MPMYAVMIAVDRIPTILHFTDTVKGKIIKRIVLSPVCQCRDNFKG